MKKLAIFLVLIMCIPVNATNEFVTNTQLESEVLETTSDWDFDHENFTSSMEIKPYNPEDVTEGKNIFTVRRRNKNINVPGRFYDEYFTIVMDMDGNIENSYRTYRQGVYFVAPEMINSTTALMQNDTVFFWNMETDIVEEFPIPAFTHDVEYNPVTDTFIGKQWNSSGNYSRDGQNYYPILYSDLYEYDREGNLLWHWSNEENIPFDPDLADGTVAIGNHLWVTINSVFWDYEEDAIYVNGRSVDTFYKIKKSTGKIEWSVGRLGDFTMYDKHGNEVDSLFYHAHSLERIGENRFILFDNDYYNLTKIDEGLGPTKGVPRLIEIELDIENKIAREVWSYAAPQEYYGTNWGDADRLPDGNTLGNFGSSGMPNWITEVDVDGNIVWEVELKNSTDYEYGMYRSDRYYESPLVEFTQSVDATDVDEISIDISTWNTFRARRDTSGTLVVKEEAISQDFSFNKFWQETTLEVKINLEDYEDGEHNFTVEITNEDGLTTQKILTVIVSNSSIIGFGSELFYFMSSAVFILAVVRSRKLNSKKF